MPSETRLFSKGFLRKQKGFALHSETKEELVVYRALYGEREL